MELDAKEHSDLMHGFSQTRGSALGRVLALWKVQAIPLSLSVISIVSIATAILLFVKSTQPVSPILFSETNASVSSSLGEVKGLMVDIEGAVARPGVYEMPLGSRIDDVLEKAGGLRGDADIPLITKTINRASRLVDGAKIYIPTIGEHRIEQTVVRQGLPSAGVTTGGLISVNTAEQASLEALPGIGPVTATKIISNRPYQTLEELVTKKAMSQSLLNKLKDQLSL